MGLAQGAHTRQLGPAGAVFRGDGGAVGWRARRPVTPVPGALHGDELPLHLGFRAVNLGGQQRLRGALQLLLRWATTRLAAAEARREP